MVTHLGFQAAHPHTLRTVPCLWRQQSALLAGQRGCSNQVFIKQVAVRSQTFPSAGREGKLRSCPQGSSLTPALTPGGAH